MVAQGQRGTGRPCTMTGVDEQQITLRDLEVYADRGERH
jgi:hypothetical protein